MKTPELFTLVDFFDDCIKKNTDKTALVYQDSFISYGELGKKVDLLACNLISKGVGPNNIVGVMQNRSINMMISILAIIKAGGAYMPISTDTPSNRLHMLLNDSSIKIILSTFELINKFSINEFSIDVSNPGNYSNQGIQLKNTNKPDDIAYTIFTSGSTGTPKGVLINHRAVVNRLLWMKEAYSIDEKDIILQKTPYIFDVSVWELFLFFFSSSTLCLLNHGEERFPQMMIRAINRNQISIMHFIPSMMNNFLYYADHSDEISCLRSLRRVFVSGEALLISHYELFKKTMYNKCNTDLSNLYGPTEATVDVTYFDCPFDVELKKIPIGKSIDKVETYVIKDGVESIEGELYLSGIALAKGYLNRPELTHEFFKNENCFNKRLYKTGDLVRLTEDNEIEFLGRIDSQVKIHGIRIELGEIESTILKYKETRNCVVINKRFSENIHTLVAYLVSDKDVNISELKKFLRKELPEYMIPKIFMPIDSLPITSSGKIDRKKLPDPS